MANRDRLIRAYLSALDLTAIYIRAADRAKLGRGQEPPADALAVWWCDRAGDAEVLAQAVRAEMGRRRLEGPAAAARLVEICAEQIGVRLRYDAELREAADAAVARIECKFAEMLKGGQLRDLNRRYKEYRLCRTAAGEKAQPYAAWIAARKLAMVKATAQAAAVSPAMAERLKGTKRADHDNEHVAP